MGLNESLFGRLHAWLERRREDPARLERRVTLASIEKRLAVFASLLAGRALDVRPADDHGGLAEHGLTLPTELAVAATQRGNLEAYLVRTALAVAALELRPRPRIALPADPAVRALASLLALPAVLAHARAQWPGLAGLLPALVAADAPNDVAPGDLAAAALRALERCRFDPASRAQDALDAPARAWLERARAASLDDWPAQMRAWVALPRPRRAPPPRLVFCGELFPSASASAATLPPPGEPHPAADTALPRGTERDAPPRRELERIELDEQTDDNPLSHVFEKVKTAEEHQAGRRELDGSDELQAHLDALSELDLRRVVRSQAPTASVYRAELGLDAAAQTLDGEPSPGAAAIPYDEWDDAARRYRRAWCAVHVERPPLADPLASAAAVREVRARHSREIRALRAEFARIARARAPRRRQLAGHDFDLDAVVDRHAALLATMQHGGRVDDGRLYVARRPATQDLATFVLLDASLSTDSWVENRRVLDVAREAVIVLGEVLVDIRHRVGVAAFFSNARRDCRFQLVKDFHEAWQPAWRRLYGIRPSGYTRIGPALRHAASLLCATRARRKLLLLVSDGKPTDYDQYEGRHGIADVRQALRESHRDGIRTIALTIDSRAKQYLPRMFGEHGYRVLRHARDLPRALARLHECVLS